MRTRHSFPARTGLGVLFLLLAQAVALATPAQAHGDTVKVVINGQREGHLTTDITWENHGEAIEEAVAATVNATSADGSRALGPWKLVRDAGTRTGWSTAEVLPAGTWKVHVHVGFPSLGHAEREVSVPVVDTAPPSTSATPTAPAPAGLGHGRALGRRIRIARPRGAAGGMLLVRRAPARRQARGDG